MSASFLDHIRDIEDPRVPGMVLYPLDEILLTVLVGLLCRAEDFDEIDEVCSELLDWLRRFLPFEHGIAPAQTLRRTLARLDPRRLEEGFAAWTARLAGRIRGVVAVDGKTVRGSKLDADGKGALHLVAAWAHEAGLLLAQRAVDAKSNEITAIPELLDMLEIEGAIVTIDAMGTRKEIAAKIVARKADYVLALKGNQRTPPCSSPTRRSRPIARVTRRRATATAASRSARSAPPTPPGSPSVIPTGRAWPASPPSRCDGRSRRPAPSRPRRGSTSRRCRPIPSAWPPRSAPTGASRTTCTGSWT